jgi:hypothetical protein
MVLDALRISRPPRAMLAAIALASMVLVVGTPAGAVTIDSFSSAMGGLWPATAQGNTSLSFLETSLSGVIGGARATRLVNNTLTLPSINTVQVGVYPSPRFFDYNTPSEANGRVTLIYNANHEIGEPGDPSEQLNADLSFDPAMQVDILDFDLASGFSMSVKVSLTDDDGDVAVLTKVVTTAGPQAVNFPYVNFTGIGAINLSNIDEISVEFDPGSAADFRIDQIYTTVPEPAALALLLMGGFVVLQRKR